MSLELLIRRNRYLPTYLPLHTRPVPYPSTTTGFRTSKHRPLYIDVYRTSTTHTHQLVPQLQISPSTVPPQSDLPRASTQTTCTAPLQKRPATVPHLSRLNRPPGGRSPPPSFLPPPPPFRAAIWSSFVLLLRRSASVALASRSKRSSMFAASRSKS